MEKRGQEQVLEKKEAQSVISAVEDSLALRPP